MSTDTLAVADEALSGGRWDEARAAYEAALAAEESAHALEGLGLALRWLEDFRRCFESQERAFLLYREAGDNRSAARMARMGDALRRPEAHNRSRPPARRQDGL